MISRLLVAAAAVLTAGLPGALHAQVDDKKPRTIETNSVIERTVKIGAKETKQKQTTKLVAELTKVEMKKDEYKYKILEVEFNSDFGDKASYKSKDATATGPVADLFKPLVNAEFTLNVDAEGKVTIADNAAFVALWPGDAKKVAEKIFDKAKLAELITGGVGCLPGPKAKAKDATTEVDLGALGTLTVVSKQEAADAKFKIKVDRTVTHKASADQAYKEVKLKSSKGAGSITCEDKGLFFTKAELPLEFELEIKAKDDTLVTVSQKQTSVTTISAK